MRDNEGREIEYLRISVTDRCNLRCIYCMPEEGVENVCHPSILTYEEILQICRTFAKHGLKKIKITGGEPLVRRGVVSLIRELKGIPGIESVTITTNGVLLETYYDDLVEAGVDAITVSLDTLDPKTYRTMTRRDELEKVLRGIQKAVAGKVRFKINCVPIAGVNKQEILKLLEFAKKDHVDVRFIEMMPIGLGKSFDCVSEDEIRTQIEETYGAMSVYCERRGNGPATYYNVPGLDGKVGFISAVSHKFCDACNRVRLTSEGFLKTCLQYEQGVDLKSVIRKGASEADLWSVMEQAIRMKPRGHHFDEKTAESRDETKGMSQIGG